MAAVLRTASRQDGMVTKTQVLELGLTRGKIRQLVARGDWLTPFPGTYLVAGADPFRGRVQAALARRPDAVICGVTAARLLDLRALPPLTVREPIHLHVNGTAARTASSGIVLHSGRLPETQIWPRGGLSLTSVTQTLADLVLVWDRASAVALVNAAAHDRRFRRVSEIAAHLLGRRGVRARLGWLAEVDARSESPLESRLRLIPRDHDLASPELQYDIVDEAGRFVARADLAYPARRLLIEADGARFHGHDAADPHPLYRDRERQNALSRLGWTVLRFTWPDVMTRPDQIAGAVRHILTSRSLF